MDPKHTLTLLTRLAARRPENTLHLRTAFIGRLDQATLDIVITVALETGDPIGRILAEQIDTTFDPTLMAHLDQHLPMQTVALRELGLAVAQGMVQQFRRHPATTNNRDRLATALIDHGIRLGQAGRPAEALSAHLQAMPIRQALATENPDAYAADLAAAYNSLAARHSQLGNAEASLAAARQAVAAYQALDSAKPGSHRNGLALALTTLANRLDDSGLPEQALEASLLALDMRRALYTEAPSGHRADLAASLNGLANRYFVLGRRNEALQTALEAADVSRSLYRAAPAAFAPKLARALHNLAECQQTLGWEENAVATTREWVGCCRETLQTLLSDERRALLHTLGPLAELLADGE